jgi:SPP1 gp7 family putative phage head morphogenesis protein
MTRALIHRVKLHVKDTARLESLGVNAALRTGFRMQRAAFTALRQNRDPVRAAMHEFHALRSLVVDAMVTAHLAGRRREFASAPATKVTVSLATDAYHKAIDVLQSRLNLSPEQLHQLETTYQSESARVFKSASDLVEQKLQRTMVEITKKGMHTRAAVSALRDAFSTAGIKPDNSYTIENIFRTQTQMAYSAGRWNADQDPAIQEILWGYEYATAGDDRVRPEHAALDGVSAEKGASIWASIFPPNGYSCRCQALSLFEPQDTVLPRASVVMEGKTVIPGADAGFGFNPGKMFRDILGKP